MIGQLRGKVEAIGETICIIDVGGVGYEVQASGRALRNMSLGADVKLTIDTHVREDAIRLYGFASEVERTWFRTLQTLQGVGAKVALGFRQQPIQFLIFVAVLLQCQPNAADAFLGFIKMQPVFSHGAVLN